MEKYRHYKGGIYTHICAAKHTENEELLTVYHDEYGRVWARPSKMFHGYTEDGEKRFELISEPTPL